MPKKFENFVKDGETMGRDTVLFLLFLSMYAIGYTVGYIVCLTTRKD